jgi:uncharacterized phage protein gp47/JayE
MVLTVTASIPATQKLGQQVAVSISGTDFVAPLRVFVDSLEPVELQRISVISSTLITGVIPGDLDKGFYNIRVLLSDDSEATLTNGLVVIPAIPAPPWGKQTFNNIMTRMLQKLPQFYDKREGSTIWDILAPIAVEEEILFSYMNDILEATFIPRSFGAYLDLLGLNHGIIRRLATKATGVVTFTGTSAIAVPVGFRVSNTVARSEQLAIFTTDTEVTLVDQGGGVFQVDADVTAVEAGTRSNLLVGQVNYLLDAISGLTSVTNDADFAGGTNDEDNANLKSRLIRHVAEPTHGGNISDYEEWAEEVDGVGKVHVEPLWNGNGTVRVLILTSEGLTPPAALLTAVKDYIDPDNGNGGGKAPIGATVTVSAPSLITIDVTATIVLASGAVEAEVITEVETNLTNYINDLDIGADVLFYSIASIILDSVGVKTITALTVNGGGIDIAIADDEKATPDTLDITV